MQPSISDAYKFLMVLAIFVIWATMIYILARYPRNHSRTISQHIASQPVTYKLFLAIGTFVLVTFYYLMMKVFLPVLDISSFFAVVLTIGTAAQLIATWIPDTKGLSLKIHRVTAYGAAIAYPIILFGFSTSVFIPSSTKYLLVGAVLVQLVAIILQASKAKFLTGNRLLQRQLFYIAVWHAGLLLTVLTV